MDKFLYAFFGWIDSMTQKVEDVFTFNVSQKRKKTKKCKYCHCKCHCNETLHLHNDMQDLCTCENCKC